MSGNRKVLKKGYHDPNIRYAISIKYLKTKQTISSYRINYELLLKNWKYNFPVRFEYLCEELDDHKILHIHGVFNAPSDFSFIQMREKGYNINIKKIYNDYMWFCYATANYKNCPLNYDLEPKQYDYESLHNDCQQMCKCKPLLSELLNRAEDFYDLSENSSSMESDQEREIKVGVFADIKTKRVKFSQH